MIQDAAAGYTLASVQLGLPVLRIERDGKSKRNHKKTIHKTKLWIVTKRRGGQQVVDAHEQCICCNVVDTSAVATTSPCRSRRRHSRDDRHK